MSVISQKDHRDVLLAPVISEKSYGAVERDNKYTFIVDPKANKTEIKIAVQKVFDVTVLNVNTINRSGKRKRTRAGWGKRNNSKRAVVTLAQGESIELFGGPVS
ncbi:MAG: 50S ribosomal protein L23 [Acidimicrobiales bacterium]|nr:MAG: 50S ribosomal protein L23 [Acidimicrobiales bacterium]